MTKRWEEIEARLVAIGPEEWDYEDPCDASCGWPCTQDGCHDSHPTGTYEIWGPEWSDNGWSNRLANKAEAEFIANAPSDIRWLLEENKRIRADVEILKNLKPKVIYSSMRDNY